MISLRDAILPDVPVYWVPPPVAWKPMGYLLTLPTIRSLLTRLRPDVVHAHYATSYGLLAALVGRRPLVISAWGSDVLIAPQRSKLARVSVRLALRRADLVTSMADHMTRTLCALGVEPAKIQTLPFGVDVSLFNPHKRTEDLEGIDVICTRPFEPVYNVELLIRALSYVAARLPAFRCALVGDGSIRFRLERLAGELGIETNIQWLGTVPPDEVAHWLSRSKVFVTTALSDGNNVSLNEAMACGTFPIATDIPANREWVTDGVNGFLVPTDDPHALAQRIVEALGADDQRRRARERNWEIVLQRANWAVNMLGMAEHYRRLVASPAYSAH